MDLQHAIELNLDQLADYVYSDDENLPHLLVVKCVDDSPSTLVYSYIHVEGKSSHLQSLKEVNPSSSYEIDY